MWKLHKQQIANYGTRTGTTKLPTMDDWLDDAKHTFENSLPEIGAWVFETSKGHTTEYMWYQLVNTQIFMETS